MNDTTQFNGIEVPSIIQSLKPQGEDWIQVENHPMPGSITATRWFHIRYGFSVISAVEVAEDTNGITRGPQYHISFAKQTPAGASRCDTNECLWLLKEFGLDGAEEDNHVPHGIVRNFWRTVREDLIGLECPCKDDEPVIRENKGDYIWRPVSK